MVNLINEMPWNENVYLQVHEMGEELVGLIGDPDRPEVEKNVDDLEASWTAAQSAWADRQKSLDEALRKATRFQAELIKVRFRMQQVEEDHSSAFCRLSVLLLSMVINGTKK